jgi:hypothetical protein
MIILGTEGALRFFKPLALLSSHYLSSSLGLDVSHPLTHPLIFSFLFSHGDWLNSLLYSSPIVLDPVNLLFHQFSKMISIEDKVEAYKQ